MFGQRFQIGDLGTIAFLVIIEALLSADNALVLAIIAGHLSPKDQKRALFYGLAGAFALRTAAILLAAFIINFWWLQFIGAIYLLYLPARHFIDARAGAKAKNVKPMSFWMTVMYLNVVDTAFALDSVIVAVAVVNTVRHPDKLWVVIVGALIGIALLRFAATIFMSLLKRFPALDHVAYALVGWAGVKLLFVAAHSFERLYDTFPGDIPELPPLIFWPVMAIIAIAGSIYAVHRPKVGQVPR